MIAALVSPNWACYFFRNLSTNYIDPCIAWLCAVNINYTISISAIYMHTFDCHSDKGDTQLIIERDNAS